MPTKNNLSDINARAQAVIRLVTSDERDRHAKMERITGVEAKHWSNFGNGRKLIDSTMIEGLARAYPQFAFWLVTGIDDARFGHLAPSDSTSMHMQRHIPLEDVPVGLNVTTAEFQARLRLDSNYSSGTFAALPLEVVESAAKASQRARDAQIEEHLRIKRLDKK